MKSLKLAAVTIFHPMVAFRFMKRDRTKFNYTPIVVILLLMLFTKIFSIFVTHYPLATVTTRNANVVMECAIMIVPIISWVVASYAMTTILSGEVMFRECLLACCYSLVPYIVIQIPLSILTNVMEESQATYFNVISNFSLLFVLLLLFINLKEMNNYTMAKTFGIIFLSLFTMILLWASISLVFALSMRFVSFVSEIVTEISFRLNY
ncbi:MAG: hypothetical protein HFI75_01920 [Lachnospiraceae bacterium]|nr:hypothetical protein [Lachnospiraceae bacterium]